MAVVVAVNTSRIMINMPHSLVAGTATSEPGFGSATVAFIPTGDDCAASTVEHTRRIARTKSAVVIRLSIFLPRARPFSYPEGALGVKNFSVSGESRRRRIAFSPAFLATGAASSRSPT